MCILCNKIEITLSDLFTLSSAFALGLATLLVPVISFVFCFVIFMLLRPYKKQFNRAEVTQSAYYRILKD